MSYACAAAMSADLEALQKAAAKDPTLLVREGSEPLVLLTVTVRALEDTCSERGIKKRLTGRDPAHGVDDVGTPELLEQLTRGARDDGLHQRLVVRKRGEHDATNFWMA